MRVCSEVLIALYFWFSVPGVAWQGASPTQVPALATRPAAPAPPADRRIVLDVVVTDHSGNPVAGLQKQDFTLLDDKQPQTIVSFHETDATRQPADIPLQVILLVDAINASHQGVAYQRDKLVTFLRHDGGELPLPTSLEYLTDKSAGQTASTQDGNVLVDSLTSQPSDLRTITRSQGFYGGLERLRISLSALEGVIASQATQPGRKLLIWLGPGWPLLSGPRVTMTDKDRATLFNTVVRLSTTLREARITLYNVNAPGINESVGNQFYYESFLKGVAAPRQVNNGNVALQVLAAQSGGRVLNTSYDLADSIARCLEDRRAFYTLTFDFPAAEHPNEYHSLQVKIARAGLTARTRTGYYAQP